jgi:glycosyltransferase involved in cell wall biosynthesis
MPQPPHTPHTVLHIGNIANNAFNNGHIQNKIGIQADVLCYDYYHIMGCPEWEETDFQGDFGDPFMPNWAQARTGSYRRPDWYIQGRLISCVKYLQARRKNQQWRQWWWQRVTAYECQPHMIQTQYRPLNALAWYALFHTREFAIAVQKKLRDYRRDPEARLRTLQNGYAHLIKAVQQIVRHVPLIRPFVNAGHQAILSTARALRIAKSTQIVPRAEVALPLATTAADSPPNAVVAPAATPATNPYHEHLVQTFARVFPERADKLTHADIESYTQSLYFKWLQPLMDQYDLVHAYSVDPIYPLLVNKRPYIAFEHGTIRHIPFEDNPRGRLTALAYHLADGVIITNSDNLLAAQKLNLTNYTFIPHPMNELWNVVGIGTATREVLQKQLNANFIVFHPPRQSWDYSGVIKEQKANHLLIEAFARFVKEVNPRAAAIFVDWGAQAEDSKALIAALGITQQVQWVKPMNRAQMARYMDACDVVADQFFIGAFGGIPPQALALGKPTLIKFDELMHEWCFPEMPPFLNVDSTDTIFEALSRLYLEPQWYAEISQQGLAWYKKYHSNETILHDTLALYAQAMQKHAHNEG